MVLTRRDGRRRLSAAAAVRPLLPPRCSSAFSLTTLHPPKTQHIQRKKAKEKKGETPTGTGATKTERKTARNAQKAERRAERALAGDEDDIDALLASFALADKARRETILEPDCAPPSPRVNGSLCAYVTPKARELVLFGGEYADLATNKVHVNADLYRFDVDRRKWTRVRAPGGCVFAFVCFVWLVWPRRRGCRKLARGEKIDVCTAHAQHSTWRHKPTTPT
jgi:hypothetical protein